MIDCVGLKRLGLAKEIVKRPQAIRTRDWFLQPPHRDVGDAFHWAFLLRIRHDTKRLVSREWVKFGIAENYL